MRRLVKNLIYLGIITAVEIGVFAHYNHLLSAAKSGAVTATAKPVEEKPTSLSGIQPLQQNLVAVSDDGQRLAYVTKDKKLVAIDVSTGKTLYSLQLLMKPVYLGWIRNDSLFIGTEVPDGSLKDLRLSTITLSSGKLRLIHVFAGFAADATFRNVTFSAYTNDVYCLIASKSASVMYHYDTNGNLNHVDLGGRYVTNADTTATSNIVYFQDFALGTPNMLMRDNQGKITVLQRNAALIRVVGNTVYYGLLDQQGNVTQVDSYTAPGDIAKANGSAGSGASSGAGSSTAANGSNGSSASSGSGGSNSSGGSGSSSGAGNTGGSDGSTGTGGSGMGTLVMTLPNPTPPSQVYVTNHHDVIVTGSTGLEDLTTKQHMKDPSGATPVERSNALILLGSDGTVDFLT